MPELPEVETIRMQLEEKIKGLRIANIEVLMKKSFIGEIGEIIERRVMAVSRRGKITIIELEGGVYLAVHLKLTGQLIYREAQNAKRKTQNEEYCEKDGPFAVCELPNKYTRVIISFNNGGKLYFNDLRIFGWIKVVKSSKLKVKSYEELPELKKLGPEANDEKVFSLDYFHKLLAKSGKPIKLMIMDQEKLAGVGNIYANEALFLAGISPTRKAISLSEEEVKKLRDSILKVLKEAISHQGSSDKDEAYRQISGEKGKHQNYLQVYGRAGQKCPSCRGLIKRITLGGRGTFFCEKCQH